MMTRTKFSLEIKQVIDRILLEVPVVVPGKMFGYPAYYINKKMFACVYEDNVGIKVPAILANELIGKKGVTYFQPLGRAKMKEWIQIHRESPEEYLKDREIFNASVDFVASLNK
jgi:hypothetical protein